VNHRIAQVPQRLVVNRRRRAFGAELRGEVRGKIERREVVPAPDELPVDLLPIIMKDVEFQCVRIRVQREANRSMRSTRHLPPLRSTTFHSYH